MWLAAPTLAQDTILNPNAAPLFGTATLDPSFLPDPHIVSLYSGGNLDVSTLGLSPDCQGFAASAPDYRVVWGGDGSTPLRLFFVGNGDATLTISQPDGTWACNDDFSTENLNPFVEIRNAPAGQYDIWVGSFAAATNVSGYLMVTEVDSYPGHIVSPLLVGVVDPLAAQGAGGGGAVGLDISADANFGTVELGPGIVPDPHTVYVVSGGSVDISTLGLGGDCRGFATAAPDYRLTLTGDISRLRIFFVAQDGGDTTLAVNLADGTWVCNDDFADGNVNPMVEITSARGGVYEIWVGSFNTGTTVAGTLYITEQDFTPADAPPV
jgi:serine protease Do